jgi:hypothetical protein
MPSVLAATSSLLARCDAHRTAIENEELCSRRVFRNLGFFVPFTRTLAAKDREHLAERCDIHAYWDKKTDSQRSAAESLPILGHLSRHVFAECTLYRCFCKSA